MKKISIQGQRKSYHDQAQQKYFGNGHELLCRDNFRAVFRDVVAGVSDYGVAAIENSLYGSINEVYDQLLRSDCFIVGEIYVRIHHCLISTNEARLDTIKRVYSQREALAQCAVWLDEHLPDVDIHEMSDTAGSVTRVAEWNDPSRAAIASAPAADELDLRILARGIETNKQNYTRFIVLNKNKEFLDGADKTSIILNLNKSTKAGSLYDALGVFERHKLNLTKLESRPIPGDVWRYMFYIDFETNIDDNNTKTVLSELKELGHEVTLLGSYKTGQMPDPDE